MREVIKKKLVKLNDKFVKTITKSKTIYKD